MPLGLKLFGTLKASARNSTLWVSRNAIDRDTARSNDHSFGPKTLLRAMFPSVPKAGSAKAEKFKKLVMGLPEVSPYIVPSTWLTRWFPAPPNPLAVSDRSLPVTTVNGLPLESLYIPENLHPVAKSRNVLLVNRGVSAKLVKLNTWRCSRRQLPLSARRLVGSVQTWSAAGP